MSTHRSIMGSIPPCPSGVHPNEWLLLWGIDPDTLPEKCPPPKKKINPRAVLQEAFVEGTAHCDQCWEEVTMTTMAMVFGVVYCMDCFWKRGHKSIPKRPCLTRQEEASYPLPQDTSPLFLELHLRQQKHQVSQNTNQ